MTEPRERLTYPQAQARVMDVERGDDLLDVTYRGWSVWPVVRPAVVTELTGASFAVERTDARSVTAVARTLRNAAADGIAYASLSRASRVFGTHATSLTHRVREGEFGDTFLHEVIEAFPGSLVLETPNDDRFSSRRPRRSRTYVTSGAIQLAGAVGRRFAMPSDLSVIADTMCERIDSAFGCPLLGRRAVLDMLAHFVWSLRSHELFFKRVRPRQVVVIDWSEHGMIAAAKASGAEVIDMQHGILNEAAYVWPDSAAAVRSGMPVADRLLMFGPYWAEQLETTGFWLNRVTAVGSIPLDRARSQAAERPRDGHLVVFTAQGIEPDATSAFFEEFMDIAPAEVRLIVKIHPVYTGDRDTFERALGRDRRVRIITHDAELSSLELISRAAVHVSISSTSHFEAIGLDTPTVILPMETWENVRALETAGHAVRAATPQELLEVVECPADFKQPAGVAERYYTSGAVRNIIRALSWQEQL